jgi:uncharacterized Zn finger protein
MLQRKLKNHKPEKKNWNLEITKEDYENLKSEFNF